MTILEDLAITAELCGSNLSDAAARVFVAELAVYEPRAVHGALARCRREVTGRLTLAAVIERLDDGRPGAEEAWGALPKDEDESALLSDEMREAMGVALPLLRDRVAARMAFVETYKRAVAKARAEHRPVKWLPSYGFNKSGQVAMLADGVARGRLTRGEAISLAGPLRAPELIGHIGEERTPALEDHSNGDQPRLA